jgi:prolyl-tRNA editing enzyme YbaK/EbsC (Cys-tRNA(Pro) deacylase)
VGGVCPFALPEGVKVYCDSSMWRFEHVYPACGSSNSAIKLTPDELMQLSAAQRCDVCKLPE